MDICDALLSMRSYREAVPKKEALMIMEKDFKGKIDLDVFNILKEEVKTT